MSEPSLRSARPIRKSSRLVLKRRSSSRTHQTFPGAGSMLDPSPAPANAPPLLGRGGSSVLDPAPAPASGSPPLGRDASLPPDRCSPLDRKSVQLGPFYLRSNHSIHLMLDRRPDFATACHHPKRSPDAKPVFDCHPAYGLRRRRLQPCVWTQMADRPSRVGPRACCGEMTARAPLLDCSRDCRRAQSPLGCPRGCPDARSPPIGRSPAGETAASPSQEWPRYHLRW